MVIVENPFYQFFRVSLRPFPPYGMMRLPTGHVGQFPSSRKDSGPFAFRLLASTEYAAYFLIRAMFQQIGQGHHTFITNLPILGHYSPAFVNNDMRSTPVRQTVPKSTRQRGNLQDPQFCVQRHFSSESLAHSMAVDLPYCSVIVAVGSARFPHVRG